MRKRYIIAFLIFLTLTLAYSQQATGALKHYFNGRDLDGKGRSTDAVNEYNTAISICLAELSRDPRNMETYAVYTWSLYRLKRYADTVAACDEALKIAKDVRIIETKGEALFYLNRFAESLAAMETYISAAPAGERASVAYFFEGEIYKLLERYNKAEIAYTAAVYLSPSSALWWYKLALVRERLENKQGAKEALTKALSIRPDYADAAKALKRVEALR